VRTTGPDQPELILLDIIDRLNEFGIPYAVVGGFAASFYGVPRATTDADSVIWTRDGGKSLDDLKNHLLASGYRVDIRRGDFEDPILQVVLVTDAFDNRVDLLAGVRGMDPDAVHRCASTRFLDSTVRIIAAEDLIGMKVFAGGPQDMLDVRNILQVSRELLNLDLLRQVARRYGSDVLHALEELLDQFGFPPPQQ
jgi:hypothetical protein